jgi:hypothetical protein
MSGPENTFIASVHRHLPVSLYRMKNHNQFNGGIADVWYSGGKADLWAEFKFITVPVRDATVIEFGLSPLQKEWLASRHREGRNVGVIVGCKAGGVWLPGISWGSPCTAAQFRKHVKTRIELARIICALTA